MGGEEAAEDDKKEDKKEAEKEKDKDKDATKVHSSANVAYKASNLSFRGSLTPVAFTNWLWWRCIRPKLEETKSKLPEIGEATPLGSFGVDDVEEIFGEFMPVIKV